MIKFSGLRISGSLNSTLLGAVTVRSWSLNGTRQQLNLRDKSSSEKSMRQSRLLSLKDSELRVILQSRYLTMVKEKLTLRLKPMRDQETPLQSFNMQVNCSIRLIFNLRSMN
jgi:hypothetical protein